MITLSADIKSISETGNYISSVLSYIAPNNISYNNIKKNIYSVFELKEITNNLINSKSKTGNPFLLKSSQLGGGAVLCSNSNYYIGKQICDENGNFDKPYLFTINGINLKSIIIKFDTFNNQHPKNIIINNVLYECNSSVFRVILENIENIEIIIDNWNVSNFPLTIQSIYSFFIEVNDFNLLSLDRSFADRGDFKLPSYGLISNYGNIELIDINDDILFYVENYLFKKGYLCTIYLNNTNYGNKQIIGEYFSTIWEYDNDNRKISVTVEDDIERLQNVYFEGINYIPHISKSQNLFSIYNMLYLETIKYGYKFKKLDNNIKNLLSNIIIEYPYLEKDSLWNTWLKFCGLSKLYMYEENNELVIKK